MTDAKKVIKGLENCIATSDRACPDDCPYYGICWDSSKGGELLYYSLMKDALELLKEQQKQRFFVDSDGKITLLPIQPQWISVKDRLPDAAGYECLVCAVNENYNQTHVFTAHTGYGEPGWWTSNVHYMSRVKSPSDNRLHPALNVTHWMPLPEPPKEEN